MTREEFDYLADEFKHEWDNFISCYTLEGKQRQRIAPPRKTSVIPKACDKLMLIPVYLKTFPLQELHAATFDMVQPQAKRRRNNNAG